TPIQEQAIPKILEGRDLMGIAQTGTGKTAAYLLPVLDELSHGDYPKDSVNCIIMSPTRELAQQIDQQVEGFAYYLNGVSSVAVYGGNDGIRFEQERKGLELGADIIIATPGRLISHLNGGHINLKKVSFFILDEADRMLDMGFYDDIMKITGYLSEERQTIMFSATMPDNILKLAQNILHDPIEVKIAVSKPAEKIQQQAYLCYDGMKDRIVEKVLQQDDLDRVILFASSKMKVKELSITLKRKGFNVGAMHSDLEQREREEMMLAFKNRRINILIATDIVSRGIDIDDIQMVINYDAPRDPEDYVHRIGRTARANREGQAITLVTPRDWPHLLKSEQLI
ncbi:MAG: DEAD/DEAH box helicase, partial [Bacteroidaceae bacterium]|nr:DEAD/DEAH box helicase [Bacteroidaceae bacterium]